LKACLGAQFPPTSHRPSPRTRPPPLTPPHQVDFRPLYTETLREGDSPDSPRSPGANRGGNGSGGGGGGGGGGGEPSQEDIMGLLDQGLFLNVGGLEGAIGGRPAETTVLLAGLSGDVASSVAKELVFKGVQWERLLFCEFF
jgi:hypothetical protein